jgi:hypothetical protein
MIVNYYSCIALSYLRHSESELLGRLALCVLPSDDHCRNFRRLVGLL